GVDTHVDTHTAAIVETATGGVLAEITVPTTPAGYQELLEMAEEHPPLRVWAVEGTGGHGAGLTHLLERESEVVFELDRPQRAKRRNGAKSDPLDAVRCPRSDGQAAPRDPAHRAGAAGPVGAAGRPSLRGRRRHGRPAPAVQPDDRRARTPACQAARPEAARDG